MKSLSLFFLVLFTLPYPATSAALFQSLYAGFKGSDQVEELSFEKKLTLNSFKIQLNQYDWKLDLLGNYLDSNLQSLFSFQSQQTVSTTYQIGLSKSSFRYGTFSVTHAQTAYDLSHWSNSSTALSSFDSNEVFESKNSINYSYEILNEFRKLEEKEINARLNLESTSQDITIDQNHYDFFVTYLNAKIRILQDRLTMESKKRALERVSLLRRRVGDGLSRSVDLNSARLSALTQDENLLKNEALLEEKLAILEDILGVEFSEKDYDQVVWTFKKKDSYPYLFQNPSYPDLKRIEALNKISELSLLKVTESQSHSLMLDLGYSINSVGTNRNEAVSDSFGGAPTDEKSVTLKYSIPIGFETNSLVDSQRRLEQTRNKLRIKNKESEFRVLSDVLSQNIERYSRAITILDKKVSLSNTIMKENKNLYTRGQVSFEEALRSEENLILTKLERINMYALYEGAIARKAFLEGKIQTFLAEYKD